MAASEIDHLNKAFRNMGINENLPMRLQDTKLSVGFPSHISDLLNPGGQLPYKEFLTRLVHVCMIEVGFIPVMDENEEVQVDDVFQSQYSESVPMQLLDTINKTGTLQSVSYRAITARKSRRGTLEDVLIPTSNFDQSSSSISMKIPVHASNTGEESGDVSGVVSEEPSVESVAGDSEWKQTYSEKISVGIIFDDTEMILIASGPGFHKNVQLSLFQYIHMRTMSFPTASMSEYLSSFNFSPYHFVMDIKRNFSYPVMDEIDGLSFDIRSLSWLPAEVIIEIAKRCSPQQIFRLRRTCSVISEALGSENETFWKFVLERDFSQYNFNHLASSQRPGRYYSKYIDMCRFTYRRPLRRAVFPYGHSRIFPIYRPRNFPP